MKHSTLLLALAVLMCGTSAAATNVSLTARFGVATAPFYTQSFPSVHGHALVPTLSGTYAISARDEIGLAFPVVLASIEQPAGAYVDEFAWGNPTLFATRTLSSELARWFGGLRVSLPLAERGAPGALLANRALAIANALDGWRDPASYFPGRLSLTPNVGVALDSRPWTFDAQLALPVLFKVSDADLPDDARARAVGVAPVVHAGVAVQLASWLIAGSGADLVVNAVRPVEGARAQISTTQFALSPRLTFPLSKRARLTADFVAPVGGSLGGSTFSGSLLLTTNW